MVKEWYWSRSNSREEGDQPGCMRGMFHFFHFHHLLFTGGCRTPATSTSPPEPEIQPYHVSRCKGLEAPRNSLELQEFETVIPEDYYGVPLSIQIAQPPAMSRKKKESPAVTPRTRSIVARLMGLGVLEDEDSSSSPTLTGEKHSSMAYFSPPAKQKKIKGKKTLHECKRDTSAAPRRPLRNLNSNFSGSLSLPDSPRVSSEKPRRERRFGFDGDENTLRSARNKPGERKYIRKDGSTNQISSPKSGLSKPVKKVQTLTRVKALKMEPARDDGDPEFNYVKAIITLAEVSMKRFSLALPIDPTIFHILEFRQEVTASVGALQHRWNRKLLFHLVEEILGDILLCDANRWRRRNNGQEQLIYRIWSEIRSLPGPAVCQVVGDIDSLVSRDLPVAKFRRLLRHPSLAAEARVIATEIERDILSALLGEAAESLCLICS